MNPLFSRYYTYIKPVLKNKTAKTYSPIVFSILTITVFSFYALRPTVKTIISLQKSIVEQKQVFDTITEKSKALSEGKKNYQKIDPKIIKKLNLLLPNQTSLPSLINSLYALSRQEQTTISGIQFQPIDLDNAPTALSSNVTIKQIDFSMNIQGTFPQLNNFLISLSKLDRLIAIQSINITKSQDTGLIMSINALAYYFKN